MPISPWWARSSKPNRLTLPTAAPSTSITNSMLRVPGPLAVSVSRFSNADRVNGEGRDGVRSSHVSR